MAAPRPAPAATPAGTATRDASSLRRLGHKFHAEDATSLQSVFGPRTAVIQRDVERLLVHAGVHAPGFPGVEGNAPNGSPGQPGIAKLPCLPKILGDHNANPPACYRDAVPRRRIESDVPNIPTHRQISVALKSDAAIGGNKQSAALRGRQPVAGIVGRLLDMQHLVSG